jgi:hypothetical protein
MFAVVLLSMSLQAGPVHRDGGVPPLALYLTTQTVDFDPAHPSGTLLAEVENHTTLPLFLPSSVGSSSGRQLWLTGGRLYLWNRASQSPTTLRVEPGERKVLFELTWHDLLSAQGDWAWDWRKRSICPQLTPIHSGRSEQLFLSSASFTLTLSSDGESISSAPVTLKITSIGAP